MKNKFKLITRLLSLFFALFLFSCKDDDPEPVAQMVAKKNGESWQGLNTRKIHSTFNNGFIMSFHEEATNSAILIEYRRSASVLPVKSTGNFKILAEENPDNIEPYFNVQYYQQPIIFNGIEGEITITHFTDEVIHGYINFEAENDSGEKVIISDGKFFSYIN